MNRGASARTRRIVVVVLAALIALALAACEWSDLLDGDDDADNGSDDTPPVTDTQVPGLAVAVSDRNFDDTYQMLATRVSAEAGGVFRVDHQDNAAGVGRTLRPTRVLFFDPVNRTAPLLAADPRAGLDLPPRMLVYRDADGEVGVAYNGGAYLAARYDLDEAENGALDGLDADQQRFAEDAAENAIERQPSAAGISEGEGIESTASDNGFAATVNALVDAINADPDLTLVQSIDFQSRANGSGRMLNPAYLLILGNPEAGTPLMRARQTAGIDLPQKMLVSQADDGTVTIYWNDPAFIANRHDISGQDDRIAAIADTLADLADTGATAATGTTASDGDSGVSTTGGTTTIR